MTSLAPLLASKLTVYSYDRRGRNESGDTQPFEPKREVEDLEAVIGAAGGKAMVFGMSSGAALAIEAVRQGLNIEKLALYEPPFHVAPSSKGIIPGHLKAVRGLVESGRLGDAVKYFQVDVVGMPAFVTFILRMTPMWKKLKAVAPTLVYDLSLLGDGMVPTESLSHVNIPAAVFFGEKSPPSLRDSSKAVARAVRNCAEVELQGQNHNFSSKALAPRLVDFLLGEAGATVRVAG